VIQYLESLDKETKAVKKEALRLKIAEAKE
jgi:hypothetical protein